MAIFKKIKNLFFYSPQTINALIVKLEDNKNIFKVTNAVLNFIYRLFKKIKKYKHYNNIIISKKNNNNSIPNTKKINTNLIAIIAELSIPQCTLYRVINKIIPIKNIGYNVDIADWNDYTKCISILQTAELVIFYRVPFLKNVEQYYIEADRLGIDKIFDIDDLIFDKNIYEEYLNNLNIDKEIKDNLLIGCNLYRKSIEKSDSFICSTKVIADVGRKYINNVHIVPNCIPDILFNISNDVLFYNKYPKKDNTVKIFYGSGTDTHDKDFSYCFEAINEILKKYNNVELYIIGSLKTGIFDSLVKDRIHKIDFINAKDYYYLISEYDINIITLSNDTFSKAKSNIKYIEASMFEIPSIAPNLFEFNNITDNTNCLIVSNKNDWFKSLDSLISNLDLRKNIGKNARNNVISLYSNNNNLDYLSRALKIKKYIKNKKHILYVNVLYGYSSFGGATIVAEKIAEEINLYKEYKTFIFTCHTDNKNPIIRYSWNGIDVFSTYISGVTLDYTNNSIIYYFNKVLDLIKPDIIHFHCIQGMGIEIIEECNKRNIPFILTMHDAWWFCPRQFMIDKNEKYCNQYTLDPQICKERCNILNKDFYKRKHRIFDALKYAKHIYTPSKIFSDQIRYNFPFCNIETNTNGIDIQKINKECNKDDYIIFGFLGGKNSVKGYFLVKNVLLNLDSKYKWKLIIIDTDTKFSIKSISKKEWNNNDNIEIVDYIPHDKMGLFYKKIDVLLFPSEWKESFGLSVREALLNNIFVILSDCGGPLDAIKDGVNGLIFPRGDAKSLEKHIKYVIKNKEYFKKYKTTFFGDIISFKQQASKLYKVYNEITN